MKKIYSTLNIDEKDEIIHIQEDVTPKYKHFYINESIKFQRFRLF